MKATEKKTSLTVSLITRDTLNAMRGETTIDDYLKSVFYYLQMFRIDPMRRDIAPNHDVLSQGEKILKRIDDTIKIVRSFEKGVKEQFSLAQESRELPVSGNALDERTQMQQTISKLREEIRNSDSNRYKYQLMEIQRLITEFVDGGVGRDGSLFVGPARVNEFKESVKSLFNGEHRS